MLRDLIARAAPAVVRIVCPDIDSEGSGFLVSPDGHIVTNSHVVAKITMRGGLATDYSQTIVAYIGGAEYAATLINDPHDRRPIVYDYAILQVPGLSAAPYLEPMSGSTTRFPSSMCASMLGGHP